MGSFQLARRSDTVRQPHQRSRTITFRLVSVGQHASRYHVRKVSVHLANLYLCILNFPRQQRGVFEAHVGSLSSSGNRHHQMFCSANISGRSDSDPRHSCLSGCQDNDDEYTQIGDTCQQTPNALRSSISQGASTSTPALKRPRSDNRTTSRNRQASTDQVEDIRVKLSLCRVSRERRKDAVCPVMGCAYKQLNGRMPDFRRHVRTHIRKDGEI